MPRMTEADKIAGRFAAAKINGGATAAEPRGRGKYLVTGRKGDRYTVQVVTLDHIACDCASGLHGGYCWHAAAAYLRHVADTTMTLVAQ